MGQWRTDGTGVQPGGDCGGDIQAGDSYSARFVRPDLPGSLMTVTFYPVEYDECPGEFVVQRQLEWMVCGDPRDPGGTEIWSDVAYDDMPSRVMGSRREAGKEARAFARAELERAWTYAWDGQPEGLLGAAHDPCWSCRGRDRLGVSTTAGGALKCPRCGALETWDGQPCGWDAEAI